MITYDILQNLEKSCLELMNSTSGMINGTNERSVRKSHERILGALRKIVIANEMNGRGIICISGLQGAGKTTLIKNFYGLGDEYFNVVLGRGEKIPVFVCERGKSKEAEMYAVCLEKKASGYEKNRIKLNSDEFKKASTGNDIYSNTMYLELCVPFQHLNNESYAFMLLPGFEKKNDYWQNLIDFSVKCSDTSIFVFNESSFAKNENQLLLSKIKEKFGDSLIYAISRSDSSADGNLSVKNTCIDVMNIIHGEEDRVVCVGEFSSKEKNEIWVQQLKRAIDKYCNSIEVARNNCIKYIYEVIEDDIRPEITFIKDSLGTDSGDALQIQLENSSYLNAFDKIIANRKIQLDKHLETALNKSFEHSRDKLERLFSDKSFAKNQGVKDKRTLVRTIFGENVKDIQLARNRVQSALKRDDGTYDFQHEFFEAISQVAISSADENECRNILTDNANDQISVFDIPTSLSKNAIEKQNEIMNDVSVLLVKNEEIPQLLHENPVETMKVIAELGVQHFSRATLQESCAVNKNLHMPDMEISKLQLNQEEITKKIGNVDKVILTTIGITGIDILEDGAINAIPKIAGALGVSVPIVGVTVAAIAAGTTSIAVINDINRLQRTELNSAVNTIHSIHTQIKLNYLSAYDEAMGLIRNRIEDNLIEISGINKKMFKKTNAMIAISKIDSSLDYISREVTKDAYDIGNAFRG